MSHIERASSGPDAGIVADAGTSHTAGPGHSGPEAPGSPHMRRILRRESYSARARVSGLAAALVIVLCVYALLESAVRVVGQPPWLIDPGTAAERIIALPQGISPLLLGASGGVIAMVGLFFLLNAVLPGRRARHLLQDARIAVVVDDEVIASALARRARTAAGVSQEQVMVVVSRRLVVVNVRPTSGVPVSGDAISAAVREELDQMSPSPMPEVRVNLSASGVIGA